MKEASNAERLSLSNKYTNFYQELSDFIHNLIQTLLMNWTLKLIFAAGVIGTEFTYKIITPKIKTSFAVYKKME